MTVSRSLTLLNQSKLNVAPESLFTGTDQSNYMAYDADKVSQASTVAGLVLRDKLQKSNVQSDTKSSQLLTAYGDNLVAKAVVGFSRDVKDVGLTLSAIATGRASRVVKSRSGTTPTFSLANAAKVLARDYMAKELKQRSYR